MELKKEGAFFSIDALIAVAIIFLIITIAYPVVRQTTQQTELHYDILSSLSNLKVGDYDNAYVQSLIIDGTIQNPNNTLLEQIGEFYITDPEIAKTIGESILSDISTNENLGLWYGTTLIASKNKSSYDPDNSILIDTARQTITGIQNGTNVTGFSARAFLSSSLREEYFYFGGYIGDGNISTKIEFNGNITSASMEMAINNPFDLYINNVSSGSYSASPSDFTPSNYTLPTGNFQTGENIIRIEGDNIHIAGGFIKITYEAEIEYQQPQRYNFPGITGLINLYDGVYIPQTPDSLYISLHLDTNNTEIILNLGNKTIYNGSTSQEETITFSNSQLSSLIDYSSLADKTTPLRLGLKNVTFVNNGTGEADVVSVTDLSGSMNNDKLTNAKIANDVLIDALLNVTGNRIGLIGYNSRTIEGYSHHLSTNVQSLKSVVSSWRSGGFTCICCGINSARDEFVLNSNESKTKAMIVMSDGRANKKCDEQGQADPKQDAILAACQAYQNYNITVHAVGFGTSADEETLQAIAACGNGSYFYADIEELALIYQQLAENIIETTFEEQTVGTSGDITTKLYPDSYIEFNYSSPTPPYGLLITKEELFDNTLSCSFDIISNATIISSNVVSYSGSRWTDNVVVNGQEIYNLEDFGKPYIELGDPYSINIPTYLLNQSNYLELTTGASKGNSSAGSASNKVIYTLLTNVSGFSAIAANANGCTWTIQFEDYTNITAPIPSNYSGSENCYYQSTRTEYNENDAIQTAVFNLLRKLDLDSNNLIDTKFTEQNLEISTSEITGIPYTWSTEVQVRTWR
ncbi:hypothetical protein CO038_01025 [Candidatus Pacearchaeota archaeon CG_4_9_14_0_2_um_filter_39_13]|nr:VWA domain-containing protein [Candidatus Pacearchaeota archaeon]OIO43110.1 MAG: hypothetical protein AUJ64_02920 [Candidatus Pacearchaeota archaeon CG1_02_39_14]PJC44958.1 MAG: hypothetical protein CO038_01025 [Candidatus Pacearchaeota archaeon CG_4_9_14_0_2_um_filter_39_13]